MRKKILMLIVPFFMACFLYTAIGYASLEWNPTEWNWFARFVWVVLTVVMTLATEVFIWLEVKNEDLYD